MNSKLRQARTMFCSSGISTAVGVSIFILLSYQDLTMAILVGLAAMLTIGFVLALKALTFLRFPTSKIRITVIQFIQLPLIGLVLTGLAYIPVQLVPRGSWQPIMAPPERALKFLPSAYSEILGHTVYILSKSGNSYALDCVSPSGCKWIEAAPVPASNEQWTYGNCSPEVRGYPFLPLAPIGVIDSYKDKNCGIDFYSETNYILLKDGSILTWTGSDSGWEPFLGIPAMAVVGLIAGIITSFTTYSLRKRHS